MTPFRQVALISLMGFLLSAQAAHAASDGLKSKPNIVFLLADDLGWTGLRCFGSDFYDNPYGNPGASAKIANILATAEIDMVKTW